MTDPKLVSQIEMRQAQNVSALLVIIHSVIRRKLLAGAEIEPGERILNPAALLTPVPIAALLARTDEDAINPAAVVRALLDGEDVRALAAEGFPAAARAKRRANLRVYRDLLGMLEGEAARCTAENLACLQRAGDYRLLESFAQESARLRRSLRALKAAGWLYRLHAPKAADVGRRALDAIGQAQTAMRELCKSLADRPIVPIREA